MPVMPKETSDTIKPKTTRPRKPRSVIAESEAVSKPRRRTSRVGTVSSAPERKAPTVIMSDNKSNQTVKTNVSRHWYVVVAMLALTFGGAAYIGLQDKGAIDVDTLMTERRRALQEDRAARAISVQNQAAVVTALEEIEEEVVMESQEEVVDDSEVTDVTGDQPELDTVEVDALPPTND
jgi:hypothetical protein